MYVILEPPSFIQRVNIAFKCIWRFLSRQKAKEQRILLKFAKELQQAKVRMIEDKKRRNAILERMARG